MASLADALGERVGPLPAWIWAALAGGGLYLFAHHQRTAAVTAQGNPTFSPFAGGRGALFGSPAALAGPVLQPNPTPTDAVNPQSGAALTPNAMYIPNPQPPAGGALTGGDNPFTSGWAGLRPTSYDYGRNGGGS